MEKRVLRLRSWSKEGCISVTGHVRVADQRAALRERLIRSAISEEEYG